MHDTMRANLDEARQKEARALDDYDKFTKVKTDNFDQMKKVFETNEEVMGTNDDTLSTKKESKSQAELTLLEDQQFLAKLTVMCDQTNKAYEKRKMMRSNEEAAVAQGIAILNSATRQIKHTRSA